VNPDHLFLGSEKDNTQDMIAKGRHAHGDRHWSRARKSEFVRRVIATGAPKRRGSRHGNAKLNEEQVIELRRLATSGQPHASLARQFGVTIQCISAIVNRVTWRHV
jgi:hypothetical protein